MAYDEHISKLEEKWDELKKEIDSMDSSMFKNHQLPLARVKKIMKSDEDVRMISAEAPVLFAKACEMFIIELTHRAWIHTEDNKRRTLQKNDIGTCISKTEIFDFLVDIVPQDNKSQFAKKEDGMKPVGMEGGADPNAMMMAGRYDMPGMPNMGVPMGTGYQGFNMGMMGQMNKDMMDPTKMGQMRPEGNE